MMHAFRKGPPENLPGPFGDLAVADNRKDLVMRKLASLSATFAYALLAAWSVGVAAEEPSKSTEAGNGSGGYGEIVKADGPVAFWRLGDAGYLVHSYTNAGGMFLRVNLSFTCLKIGFTSP